MSRVPVRPLLAHHHEFEYGPADYGRVSAGIRRVSWGAIAAGAAVALAAQVGLGAFGVVLGVDVVGGTLLAGAWLLASALFSMFLGGLVTGRLAGMPRLGDGAVHGLVAWGVATLLAATVLASALAPAEAPAAPDAVEAFPAEPLAVDLSGIRAEATGLLLADTTATPEAQALLAAIDDAFGGAGAPTDAQQETLVAALAGATGLTEAQARQTVGRWIVRVEDARTAAAPIQIETADEGSGLALWSALALVLGALAAVLGGAAGTPGTLPAAPPPAVPPTEAV